MSVPKMGHYIGLWKTWKLQDYERYAVYICYLDLQKVFYILPQQADFCVIPLESITDTNIDVFIKVRKRFTCWNIIYGWIICEMTKLPKIGMAK